MRRRRSKTRGAIEEESPPGKRESHSRKGEIAEGREG